MKHKLFIHGHRFNKLFLKSFFRIFMVCIVVMTVAVGLYYKNISEHYFGEMTGTVRSTLKRTADISETIFREIEFVASGLLTDGSIRMYMYGNDKIYSINEVTNRISIATMAHEMYIHSIYVYSEVSGTVYKLHENLKVEEFDDKNWLEAYNNSSEKFIQLTRKVSDEFPYVITFIKRIDGIGAIIVNIDIVKFMEMLGIMDENQLKFYIFDENNKIVYCNDMSLFLSDADKFLLNIQQGENNVKVDGKKYYGECYTSKKYALNYIVISNYESYNREMFHIRIMIVVISMLFLMFVIIISYLIAEISIRPVYSLIEFVDYLDKTKLDDMRDEEVRYVAEKIICWVDECSALKEEMNEKIKEYTKYHTLALQSQISPHFLNNTISDINYSVIDKLGSDDDISRSLVTVTRMIQYCFVRDEFLASFGEEIGFINMYAEVMKGRYGEFKFIIDVNESFMDKKIIRLSLQPLVENAIYHGIINNIKEGVIKISAKETERELVIEVYDNGEGMTDEQINIIKESFSSNTFELKHIGLKSVYKRLKTIYGNEADLELESVPNQYTKIIIIIPIKDN